MKLPKKLQPMLWSTLGACLVLYFLYHTIQGEHGWLAAMRLEHKVKEAETTLDALEAERGALEHRVKLMRKDSLDIDLLDEKARATLNYTKPNEIVILTGSGEKPAIARP